MSVGFIFYLGHSLDAPLHWGKLDHGQLVDAGKLDNAAALVDFAQAQSVEGCVSAIISGEHVALRTITAPPKSRSKFLAAARYLLEDELAEPVDATHVVTSHKGSEGRVIAIRNEIIDAWCGAFADAGLDLDFLSPDFLCLPDNDGNPVVAVDEARIVARVGARGFAAAASISEFVIGPMARDGSLAECSFHGNPNVVCDIPELSSQNWRPLGEHGLFGLCAVALDQRQPENLLQGKRQARGHWRDGVKQWRRAGSLAAALIGVLLSIYIVQGIRDMRVTAAYEDRTNELHAQYFPDAANVDPYTNARAVLSSSADSAFLSLSSAVSDALVQTDGVRVDRMRYDQTRNQLVISVRSGDNRNIEAFRAQLASAAVPVRDAGGYRRSNNEWVGDLIVGQ